MKNKIIFAAAVLVITGLIIGIFFKVNGVVLISSGDYNSEKDNGNTVDPTEGNTQSANTTTTNTTTQTTIPNNSNREPINAYLFWGNGCPRCEELIQFLDSIESEYGKYYNLIKYEVWYNDENKDLMNSFSNLLNEVPAGVPYLIIGDKSIVGYSVYKEQSIKNLIIEQYNNEKYVDLYEEIKNEE